MVNVQCPACKRFHQAPETLLGQQAQCKDCGSLFTVTPAQQASPQPPQQTPVPQQQFAQAPVGQPYYAQPGMPGQYGQPIAHPSIVKPLLIVGGSVVGLGGLVCLFFFLILPMISGGGVPSWTKTYIPDKVTSVGYTDYGAMRDKAIDKDEVNEDAAKPVGTKIKGSEINAIFRANAKDMTITVIKVASDIALKDAVDGPEDAKTVNKHEYSKFGFGNYVSKIDKNTYCVTSGQKAQDAMEEVLKRVDGGEKAKVPPELQKVIDFVSSERSFNARYNNEEDAKIIAEGSGETDGSSLGVKKIQIYASADTAKKAHEDLMKENSDQIDKLKKAVSTVSKDDKPKVETALYVSGLGKPTLTGKVIKMDVSVSLSTLRSKLKLKSDASMKEVEKAITEGFITANEATREDRRSND